jgi:2-polyprenyl-6-methoxyphenol hydroxylase-like FAD-dependent oxidoreductase
VTLVERAATIRTGGYAIDIRGTAIDVIDRMGILPAVRAEHVATRQVTFVNAQGRQVARVNPEDFAPGGGGRHVELARGALTSQLFDLIRSQVKHRFGDAISSLSDGPNGVDVGFKSGASERFDLVVSGEGLHSTTRTLVFGPEASFSRYWGYCFAICELPNKYALRREAVIYNKPGKAAVLYCTGQDRVWQATQSSAASQPLEAFGERVLLFQTDARLYTRRIFFASNRRGGP